MRYVLLFLLPVLGLNSLNAQSFEDYLGRFAKPEFPMNLPVEEITISPNQKLPFARARVSFLGNPLYLSRTEMRAFFPEGLESNGKAVYHYPILRLSDPSGDVHGALVGSYTPGGEVPWVFHLATYTTRGKRLAIEKVLELNTPKDPMKIYGEFSFDDITHFTATRRVIVDPKAELNDQELMATRPHAVMTDWQIDAKGGISSAEPRKLDLDR